MTSILKEEADLKKAVLIVFSTAMLFSFVACGKDNNYEIEIIIPAGTTEEIIYQEDFFYSDEEISPLSDTIRITAGAGFADTEVVLKPIEVKEENAYEPTYLTHGMPVEMDVEKGAWFKIGLAVQNPTDVDIAASVYVEDVQVRIE